MGKRTKKAFIAGILFIIFASGYKPILLITLGKEADGKILYIQKEKGTRSKFPQTRHYPIVEFNLGNNQKIVFSSGQDIDKKVHYGQHVKVLFLPSHPHFAEINSFHCLFDWFLIKAIISLLVWVAFMTSYNDIFDKKIIHPVNSTNTENINTLNLP